MAAPYVTALAALLMARGRTPQQTIDASQQTAHNPSKNAKLGLGNVDAAAAVASRSSSGAGKPTNKQDEPKPAESKSRRKRR
jgi:hypothetical protein